MVKEKLNTGNGVLVVQSGNDELCPLNRQIYEIFNGSHNPSSHPQNVYRAVIVHIDPKQEHGGLFDTRKIVYKITKEFHTFIMGITALPSTSEWVDWAYAVGYDALLFYIPNQDDIAKKISIIKRAEKIFPGGACGLISETLLKIPEGLSSEYYCVNISSIYFLLPQDHPFLEIISSNDTATRLSVKDKILMTVKNMWFKLRRNLRVKVEED